MGTVPHRSFVGPPYHGSVRRVGPLIASGRDADVYEYGEHLVLRRARTGRSMALEARVMEHVRAAGYPVPRIEDVSADGSELVMERVVGPSMLEDITRRPWTLQRHGAALARLHEELHELDAPGWLSPFATAPGARIGHYDLHPVNVLMSPAGPVVIDWSNAGAGTPASDVAMTWVLLAAGRVDAGVVTALFVRAARRRLIDAFLARFDRDEVAAQLEAVVAWKARDSHMSPREIATMRDLARAAAPRAT